MRIFVAGATGALERRAGAAAGRQRPPGDRHDPHRRQGGLLRAAEAEPVVADALDREAVTRAVADAQAEVVVLAHRPGRRPA